MSPLFISINLDLAMLKISCYIEYIMKKLKSFYSTLHSHALPISIGISILLLVVLYLVATGMIHLSSDSFANEQITPTDSTIPTVIQPVDDALVKNIGSNTASKNYSTGAQGLTLRTRSTGSEEYQSFLKFDYSASQGQVVKAILRLYAYDSTRASLKISQANNNWKESTVTWNTRPAIIKDSLLTWQGPTKANTLLEIDVTKAVFDNTSNVITFALSNLKNSAADDSYYFYSAEGKVPPQLVLYKSTVVAGGPVPTVFDPPEPTEVVVPTRVPTVTKVPTPQPTTAPNVTAAPIPTKTPTPTRVPTLIPTTVQQQPPVVTVAPGTPPQQGVSEGLWISPEQLASLPMSGSAWNFLVSQAKSTWGEPCLFDNNCETDVKTLGGALYAARTGDAAMKTKVENAIDAAIPSRTARALEVCRGLQTYIIAADIIGYHTQRLDNGIRELLYRKMQGHSGADSIVTTAQLSANNWGGHCRATTAAAAIYLNDPTLKKVVVDAYLDFIGVSKSKLVYSSTNWHANSTNQAGVNRKGTKINGISVSGVLTEDWRRGSSFAWLPTLSGYMWEGEQGFVVTAVLLDRAGLVPFSAGDNVVVRSLDMLYGTGEAAANSPKFVYAAASDDTWIPWVVNHYAGTNYPTAAANCGKNMCYTDWMYAR